MGNADLLSQIIDKVIEGFEKAYPDLHKRFYFEVFMYGKPTEETQAEWSNTLADYINAC